MKRLRTIFKISAGAIAFGAAVLVGVHYRSLLTAWAQTSAPTQSTHDHSGRKILYWYDVMNPEFRSDKPGKAPDGMDLVPKYGDSSDSSQEPAAHSGEAQESL